MNYSYTIWNGQEPFACGFDNVSDVMEVAEEMVHRYVLVNTEITISAISWVLYVDDISDVEKAEKENWVRTGVTIIKETEDESSVVARFFAFVLPRPAWDCGVYEFMKAGK